MSFYRDTYLKSEDWKSLRAAKLHQKKSRCELCGDTSGSNDVHHLKYLQLYNVLPKHLMVLCRECHDAVHSFIKKYPCFKTLENLMATLRNRLHKQIVSDRLNNAKRRVVSRKRNWFFKTFSEHRKNLKSRDIICRHRMPLLECLYDNEEFVSSMRTSPDEMLRVYMLITNRDPRRMVLDIVRDFPKFLPLHKNCHSGSRIEDLM